jgi:hypothetical protein
MTTWCWNLRCACMNWRTACCTPTAGCESLLHVRAQCCPRLCKCLSFAGVFNCGNCETVILASVQDIKLYLYVISVCCGLFGTLCNTLAFGSHTINTEKHSWAEWIKDKQRKPCLELHWVLNYTSTWCWVFSFITITKLNVLGCIFFCAILDLCCLRGNALCQSVSQPLHPPVLSTPQEPHPQGSALSCQATHNISLLNTAMSPKWFLPSRLSNQNFEDISYACYMLYLSHIYLIALTALPKHRQ